MSALRGEDFIDMGSPAPSTGGGSWQLDGPHPSSRSLAARRLRSSNAAATTHTGGILAPLGVGVNSVPTYVLSVRAVGWCDPPEATTGPPGSDSCRDWGDSRTARFPATTRPNCVNHTILVAQDGDWPDGFGWSVAEIDDGNAALVRAFRGEDPHGAKAGAADVFRPESEPRRQHLAPLLAN